MRQHRWSTWALVAVILCHVVLAAPGDRFKRQSELSDNPSLDPNSPQEIGGDVQTGDRPKRKLEGVAQIGFEAKNAVLGFLFGKINQLIDSKTRLVAQLDQTNIAKNKQYGIEAPGAPSFGGFANVISSVIGPKISFITTKLGSLSSGGFGGSIGGSVGGSSDASSTNSGLGGLLSSFLRLSGPLISSASASSNGGASADSDPSDE